MVERLKLEVIDGRAPPRVASVALFDPAREKLTRSTHSKDVQIGSTFLILRVVGHGRSKLVETPQRDFVSNAL